jgi:hypothetical protein
MVGNCVEGTAEKERLWQGPKELRPAKTIRGRSHWRKRRGKVAGEKSGCRKPVGKKERSPDEEARHGQARRGFRPSGPEGVPPSPHILKEAKPTGPLESTERCPKGSKAKPTKAKTKPNGPGETSDKPFRISRGSNGDARTNPNEATRLSGAGLLVGRFPRSACCSI